MLSSVYYFFDILCKVSFIFVLVATMTLENIGIYAVLSTIIPGSVLAFRLSAPALGAIWAGAMAKRDDDAISQTEGCSFGIRRLLTAFLFAFFVLCPMLIVLQDVIDVARLQVSFGTLLTAALLANLVKSVKRSIDRSDRGSVGHMEMMSTVIAIMTIAILAESQGLLAIFIGEIIGITTIVVVILVYRLINKKDSSSGVTIDMKKEIHRYTGDLEQASHCVFVAFICALYLFAEISEIATVGIGFIGSQLALACWQFAAAHSVWHSTSGDRQKKNASWHAHVVHDGFDKSHRRVSTSAMACLFLSSPLMSYALFGELQTTFVGFAWLFCTAYWILLLNLPGWFFLQTHRSLQNPLAIANRTLMACGILMTGGLMVQGALGAALGLLGGLTFGALSIAGRSYKQKLREYGPQGIGGEIDGIVFSTILLVLFGIILTPLASGGVAAAAVLASFSIIVVLLVLP